MSFYVQGNPKSKKQIREWLASGDNVYAFPTGPFESLPINGTVPVQGPHYPQPHRWYGIATIRDGKVVKVK